MRTLTTTQSKLYANPDGYQARARVSVKDSGGTWRDLSSLEGLDWLVSARWNEHIDQPVAQLDVALRVRHYDLSLAPLMSGKLSGYVNVGREIKLEVAIIPKGIEPVSGDWQTFFHGYVRRASWPDGMLTITAEDLGRKLKKRWVEVDTNEYGADDGSVEVEDVMQDVLDDALGAAVVSVYVPSSPAYPIRRYKQKKQPLLDALQALAVETGFDIRYRWHEGTSAFRLTYSEPDRDKTVPDFTLSASRYLAVHEVAVTDDDVRNVVKVTYTDPADLDAAGAPKRKTVSAEDATSITAYDRQFCEFAEASASHIDTAAKANRMRDAALADMKDPLLDHELEIFINPHLELNDLIRCPANGVHYSSDQDLAAVSLTHEISEGKFRTRLGLRGKPTGPRLAWFEREARPGVAPSVPFATPDAPSSVAIAKTTGGIAVTFDPPTVGKWDMFELHLSTSSGFTPSSSTYKGQGIGRIEASDLTPGTTYYAKVVPRDAAGNRGTASAQVSIAAGYVTPLAGQPEVGFHSLVPNGSFEANNVPGEPPDCWTYVGDGAAWGAAMDISTDSYSGGHSVYFQSNLTDSEFYSQFFVVREGDRYSLDYVFKADAAGEVVGIPIQWFTDAKVFISENGPISASGYTATVADTWYRGRGTFLAPANARYARIDFSGESYTDRWYLDSIAIEHIPSQEPFRDIGATGEPTFQNSWVSDPSGAAPGYRLESTGHVRLRGTIQTGTLTNVAFTLPAGYRPAASVFLAVISNGSPAYLRVDSNGDVVPMTGSNAQFALDGATFPAEQ